MPFPILECTANCEPWQPHQDHRHPFKHGAGFPVFSLGIYPTLKCDRFITTKPHHHMVYLIHLKKKFHNTQHYVGFSHDDKFDGRIWHHQRGTGARFLKAANLAGIKWTVVHTWPKKDGHFERLLKRQKNAKRFCPVCNKKKKRPTKSKYLQIELFTK
jgi:predicted GIY-YIG superfamily endonuclease